MATARMAAPTYPPAPAGGPLAPVFALIEARLFAAVVGRSPIAHLRRVRLAVAARRLATEPGLRLIELALDCGFESQEAFTRAFAREFGEPPGRFRRAAAAARQLLQISGDTGMGSPEIDLERTLTTESTLQPRPAFRVAGLRSEYDAGTRHEIPLL